MTKEQILHTLRLARAYCADKLVWFAPALYKTNIVLTTEVPLAAIDTHFNIYWNPKTVTEIEKNSLDLKDAMAQLGFVWIHEIAHLLRDHRERAKDIQADAKIWNIATDLEINDGTWKGLKMPDVMPGLVPVHFKLPAAKLAEWYYQYLLKDEKCRKECQACCNGSNKGAGNGKLKSKNPDTLSQEEGDPNSSEWDEGSGVHGESRPWETGENRQELHAIDKEITKREVAQRMKDQAKNRGTIPGSWKSWIEEVLESKTDWKQLLKHRMSRAIATGRGLRVDYSFRRPSRRQTVYQPIITPSFAGERSGQIAVVVDTSGSMGGPALGQAVAEVCKVLDDFKLPVTVIPCDAKAYEPIVVRRPSDRLKIQKLKGGGGTNMIVGIEAALALQPKPDGILVLTDGHTPYPPAPYKVPIIFGIFKSNNLKRTPLPSTPPWSKNAIVDIILHK